MGGGGSGGLCHMKVGDKIDREAAEISQILTFPSADFLTKIQNFLPKNHKTFLLFNTITNIKIFLSRIF